jgi:ribonuclease P protein component
MPEGAGDARELSHRPDIEAMRDGYLFRETYRSGRRYRGSAIEVVYRSNTLGRIRLGFSVSRKSGKAVLRNLFRRRIRTLIREEGPTGGMDMIFSPAGRLEKTVWAEIREEFREITGLSRERG